jgi:hypothetical protein
MKLSQNFTLAEFEASEVAARKGIDNGMPEALWPNAIALCNNVLESARAALGPIRVNSGYRCRALNVAITGGATRSQHTLGQAADIIPLAAGVKLMDLFAWLVANAPYDQLIWEFGQWIHVSYTNSPRGNIMVAAMVTGKKRANYTEITADQLSTLV